MNAISKLKVVEIFAGLGAWSKALQNLGVDHEVVLAVENDKYPLEAYNAIHNTNFETIDITELDEKDVPDCDIICYSPPCFKAGTYITTHEGLKFIEDIKVGDMVLTHKNRFRKVLNTSITPTKGIYKLKVQGSPITYVTEEHPYYVREKIKTWNNNKRKYEYSFSEPKWKKVRDLSQNDFIGFALNKKNDNVNSKTLTHEEAWLIGRYVADGYQKEIRPQSRSVIIDNILWQPFKNKEYLIDFEDVVFNFEVEEDNSYVANNCIVHNCQTFSPAGRQEGFDDHRGILFFDALRIIKEKQPKFAIMENVKGLTQKKFENEFKEMQEELEKAGYNNYWKILNSREHGIPQNRERVFLVSIRKDIDKGFVFPEPITLKDKLKSRLETDFETIKNSSHTEKAIDYMNRKTKDGRTHWDFEHHSDSDHDVSRCLTANMHKGVPYNVILDRRVELIDYLEEDATLPILHNIYGGFKESKARVFNEYSPTIRTSAGGGHVPSVIVKGCSLRTRSYRGQPQKLEIRKDNVSNTVTTVPKDFMVAIFNGKDPIELSELMENASKSDIKGLKLAVKIDDEYRLVKDESDLVENGEYLFIREMTNKEAFRLMGFTDEDYETARKAVNDKFYKGRDRSKTRLFRMAGNSIVVNVCEELFKSLFNLYPQK